MPGTGRGLKLCRESLIASYQNKRFIFNKYIPGHSVMGLNKPINRYIQMLFFCLCRAAPGPGSLLARVCLSQQMELHPR